MKKILLLLLTLPILALANPVTSVNIENSAGLISIKKYPRVLVFRHERQFLSPDGEILICPHNMKAQYSNYGYCTDHNDKSGWLPVTQIKIPGFKLAAYELKWAGHSDSTKLILYFSAK